MSAKIRFTILISVFAIIALSLFQLLFQAFKDIPILDMNSINFTPTWSECNTIFANEQMDTVASCIINDNLEITLSLKSIRKMHHKSFIFKEGRYEKGRYRTYYNGGVGNGVGYTNALVGKEVHSRLYFAVDSIIHRDSLTGTCIFVSQYVTISDDDSRLLTELRLPRRSTAQLRVDSSSTGILLRIIAAERHRAPAKVP